VTEFGALETLGEIVSLLSTKEVRDNGLEEKVFHLNGITSIEVAATALRARGYEVEIFELGGVRRMRLLATPAVGARKRAKEQVSLFDAGAVRGPYDPEAA